MPTGQLAANASDTLDTRQLLKVLMAVKKGDFSLRMPVEHTGVAGKIADTLNDIIDLNQHMTTSSRGSARSWARRAGSHSARRLVRRVALERLRRLGQYADHRLAHPTTEMTRVIGAVARGDLSQTIALEIDGRPLQGEFLRTGTIVNTMVDQLNGFASEVTRVAREVGTEGKLGGQAEVRAWPAPGRI